MRRQLNLVGPRRMIIAARPTFGHSTITLMTSNVACVFENSYSNKQNLSESKRTYFIRAPGAWNAPESTPLHAAAENGDHAAIEALIAKGTNVNAIDKYGNIPLHFAAHTGDVSAVKVLIAKGSNVNASNTIGKTPLHYAAENGHTSAIKVLIAKGSNVNAMDREEGWSPLHYAAYFDEIASMEVLIAKGSNVNAVSTDGQSILDRTYGKAREVLIANGAGDRDDRLAELEQATRMLELEFKRLCEEAKETTKEAGKKMDEALKKKMDKHFKKVDAYFTRKREACEKWLEKLSSSRGKKKQRKQNNK